MNILWPRVTKYNTNTRQYVVCAVGGYDFANRYRNVGIFIGFIAFNYTAVIVMTYVLKVKKWKQS